MHRHIPLTPYTEETAPGQNSRMGVYASFVWLAMWVIILGKRAGVISPEFLMPPSAPIAPTLCHRNRQLRRARASCLRRARRCAVKHGKVNPEDYTPRAYAHFAYVSMMDKTITPGQFKERYIRDSNYSRVQVYEMDSADHIARFVESLGTLFSSKFSNLVSFSRSSSAILSDPAPP